MVILLGIVLGNSACNGSAFKEVEEMQPWPQASQQPASILPPNLNDLGLGDAIILDARISESIWSEGTYDHGAVAEYTVDSETAVWIAALRYDESDDAGDEYAGMVSWAEENCGWHGWIRIGGAGIINCGWSDAFNKTLMNDIWIVDIIAQDTVPTPPDEFVNRVRDAIAEHWDTLD